MVVVFEGTVKCTNKGRKTERGLKEFGTGFTLEAKGQWTPRIPFRFLACFGSVSQCGNRTLSSLGNVGSCSAGSRRWKGKQQHRS